MSKETDDKIVREKIMELILLGDIEANPKLVEWVEDKTRFGVFDYSKDYNYFIDKVNKLATILSRTNWKLLRDTMDDDPVLRISPIMGENLTLRLENILSTLVLIFLDYGGSISASEEGATTAATFALRCAKHMTAGTGKFYDANVFLTRAKGLYMSDLIQKRHREVKYNE